MSNLRAAQDTQKPQTKLLSAKVPLDYHKRVRVEAANRGMFASEAVRQAMDLWLQATPCPICDQPTTIHPDPLMTGVSYCRACQQPVSLEPSAQAAQ